MSEIITKKTKSPFVVELSEESVYDAKFYPEDAGNVTVYTGNTEKEPEEVSKTTFIGSGLNAALKNIAAGATYVKDFSTGEWTYDKKGNPVPVKGSVSSIELNGGNNVTVNAVTIKGAIYGGALALTEKGKITTKYIDGVTAIVNGDVSLVLNNTNANAVYGGGAGYGAAVNGNVSISYSGGNIAKMFGGGYTGSVLNGDVSIFIDGRATGKIGTIYAGGYNSVVNGNATVTFTNNSGLYNNLSLGTVSGGGYGKAERVTGDSTLVFDNYSGNFKATITDFDLVKISGKSSVILVKGQNKTMKGATFEFVINEDTFGLQGAMLTWNSKVLFSNVVVSVETTDAIDVTLIQSKYFKTAKDFSIDSVLVVNEEDEKLSTFAYELTYNYDKKLGGSVSISYKGVDLNFSTLETEKVVLSGSDDEVNIISGGNLAGGLSTGGGNDTVTLGSGVEMTGNIALGAGDNKLNVQQGALMSGTIIFSNGTAETPVTNTVTVNGAVMGFSGGNAFTNNLITLNGDTVKGGGVGYWATLDVYVDAGYWTKLDVFVVRDLILSGEANDTVIIGNGASVNNIYLGGGNDKLIINQGANIGYDYVSAADWTGRGNVIAATINLGTGNDILVLNAQLGDNVNVITADDGGDVIVIGADMAINDNQLLVGSTNNTLVVANGRQVTFNDVMSWGNFVSGSAKYDAFYLSQNAMINFDDSSVIENYTGTLFRDGDILVIGAPTVVPAEIAAYYTAGNGVTNSSLYAEDVDLADGGKITSSKVIAEEVYVHGGTSIDNSAGGFVSVEDYILVANNASVSGKIYLGYEPTHELSSGATADIAGTVGAIAGGADSDQVNVTSGTASIGSIDLGAGQDTVAFSSGTFADANLVIANTEMIVLGNGADVTVGNATGYADVTLGENSKFTEVMTKTVTIGDWNVAISFADGYTVRLNGTVSADATLTNNTVLITDRSDYFAGNIFLNGANTFSIQSGVQDWYDWQQFKFGSNATLGFKLGEESFFALDGFVGPTADAASIVASTEFGQNSGLGLGTWVYIKDWNDAFDIVNIQNIYGSPAYAPSLVFENLNVVAGAEIYGYIQMDNAANQVVINDGVVMNGDTAWYDYAAIQTLGGDDTVTVGVATINGRILTGDGNDTVALNGTTINTAINQGVPAVELGDGDDEIALAGATVNGSVAFGAGDDLLTSTGISSVSEIVFGAGDNTVEVTGGTLTAGAISFDAAANNNTIEVQTGATFNVASPVELVATGSNEVLLDGGAFGVAGSLELEGPQNSVVLSNGGHVVGLGELAMTGEGNTLELSDSATSQTADTVVMNGSINQVENAGTLTATDSVKMIADGLNRIVNSATGSIQADSLAMVGDINDTVISGAATDVIENEGTLTADSILLAADSIVLNNQGTVSAGALMANDGIVTDAYGYQITGNAQIQVNNAEGASLVASGDINLFSAFSSLINAGSVQAGNLLMARNETFTVGVSDVFGASDANFINNQESGTLNVGDVTMFGNLNTINNEGDIAAGDILMAADTVTDLTDGGMECNAADGNEIHDFGTMTAASLSMAGTSNTIQLAGFVDSNNVGGSLDVAGTLVMGGDIDFESGLLSLVASSNVNIINLATANAADADQTDAVTASLNAGTLAMIGMSNSINATATYDASVGTGATEGRTLQVGAVSQSITADSLLMAGITNRMDIGVSALASGLYDADSHHLQSRLELGTIAQTLDADVEMRGSNNLLNLGVDLTSTEEGNLVVSGIAVNSSGDISMEGSANTLVAQANLTAGTQSVLEMQGDVLITMDGDISMRGSGTNTIDFGTTLTETPAALPGESGGVIERNGHEAKVVVNGDIAMVGTGAVNMFDIGENTYYTGNVTMGEVYGDDLSQQNILNVADVGNINFTSLSMTAVNNLVTLNGQGTIGTVNGIQGGTNVFTIGKDVEVNTPIVFRDIVDADLIGTEGYTILANTVNVVTLYGKAAGIDSSATNADDTFQVSGGLITGDILTGSSANSDFVTIGGGVTQGAWDAGMLNDRHESVVEGSVTMGTADSVGVNVLNIQSAVLLDADGNEVGFGAGIDGDVTMTSTVANMLTATGADTTPDLDGKFIRFGAEIGGSLTMNGGNNTAFLSKGSIGGSVTAVAAGAGMSNLFQLSEFVVVGNTDLDAEATNSLIAGASILSDVAMTAVDSNTLQLSGSTAAGIVMTATDGFNTAAVANSITGSIAMTAEQDLNGLANINNRLDLLGQVIPAVDPTQKAPVVIRSTVSGDVTMTAVNDNTLNLGLEDSGAASEAQFGSVEITGALTMAALSNTVEVWAGTEASYLGGPSAGSDLDMRALVGSIAMDGKTNAIEVNQGALGVTTGGVTLANLDKDGDVIVSSSNSITVNDNAMLVLEEAGGVRQAISMGSKSVDFGAITTSGNYGDIGYLFVTIDASGYETYYYAWHDTSTTDPDTAAATESNTIEVSGKLYAGDLSMTAESNTIKVTGPAVQDPEQLPVFGYAFDVATVDVADVEMFGRTNLIDIKSSAAGYDAEFLADSVTMGDVEVVYASGTVKVLAEANTITSADNTYLNINGVSMTATTANTVDVGDYTRLTSANASDLVAGDGNLLVANAGDYDGNTNPHVKEIDDVTTNTLGDVAMSANGVTNTAGVVVSNGTNTLDLGQNSTAADVTMTGYTNNVTLAGDTQATYFEVDPVTGAAVMDGGVQKTETVTLQNAAVIDDLVFHLPAGMAGAAPTNTLAMGAGSTVTSVTSTDTWSVVVGAVTETYGAVDFIGMGERSTITGDVSLGYGNDVILMADGSEIAGSVYFGAGADVLSVSGAATVHAVDFGTNVPVGEALILGTNATLTVKGDITYKGTLNVFGALGASIVFSDGFAFKSEGTDAKLILRDLTTFGNINSQDVTVYGALSVGNGKFSNGTMTFGSGSGTLNILPQKDADDQIIGATFEIADTGKVLFSDAGTWLYDGTDLPTYGQPTASNDVLNIADGAQLDLKGGLNFGTGANEINLGKSAIFNVNRAWETTLAAVNANGAAVNVDGKTESEVPAGTFVPLEDNTGTVGITMDHGSKLNATANITAADGITLQGYYLAAAGTDPEVIGSYTITGSGTISADIGVSNTAMAYKLDLSATVDGDVTFGAGADTLTISADSEVNALAFGTGNDTLVLSGDLAATGLTYGGTLTVSGTGDVTVDTLTIGHALTTADTVGWDVDTFTVNTTTVTGKLVLTGGDNDLTLNGATLSGGIDFGAGTDTLTASTAASTIGGVSSTGTLTISGGDELLNFSADVTVQTGSVIFDLGSLSDGDTLMSFSGSSNNWSDLTSGDFDMVMAANGLTTDEYVDLTSGFDLAMGSWNMDASTKVLSDVTLKIGDTVISNFTYDSVNDWAIASVAGTDTWKLKEEADGTLRLTYLA